MNIGIATDGDSEVRALPLLRNAIEATTGNRLMAPVLLRTTPLAPVTVLAAKCHRAARILSSRGAQSVVILVDREMREDCPTKIARELNQAINGRGLLDVQTAVVVKDRTFENWLISDPDAIVAQPARFRSTAIANAVARGRADEVVALRLLEQASFGPAYNKVRDSERILSRADVRTMARNSRSFRCFLRRLGHPDYPNGSRQPASE